MKLVLATPDDSERYSQLRNGEDTYKWFFSEKKYTAEEIRSWLIQTASEGDLNFLGYESDVLVGAVSLYNIDKNILLNAEVGRVIVSENQRGKGYGTKLLNSVLEEAKKEGLDALYAFVKRGNVPSQRAFESAKYKDSGSYIDKCEYYRPVEID